MGRFDKLYAQLPVPLQNAGVTAFGLPWRYARYGPGYKDELAGFLSRESYSPDQWEAWTQARLRQILTVAADHVPYYRRTWTAEQHAAAMAGCLSALPLLEKEPIRINPRDFVRDDISPRPQLIFRTSGSTGTPIQAVYTLAELRRTQALREARSAKWAGVSFDQPRATFSGRMVVPDPASPGPYHRYNAAEKQVYFSAFHLGPKTARQYVNALIQHKTIWMTGYSSSIYILARLILEQGLPRPKLKAIITTSERLEPAMRPVIKDAFGCRVFEEYGTVENVLFASECEQGRLHVSPDCGIIEILRPDGSSCDSEEPGEVVATCLCRDFQPMVRFRLGDVAAWDSEPCPCSRHMPVLKEVCGRIEDVVVGPDGRETVRFHGLFTTVAGVREGQVIQEALDRIRVKVVPAPNYSVADAASITVAVKQRLGDEVSVVVEPVEALPRTTAGKVRAVVSLISKPSSNHTVASPDNDAEVERIQRVYSEYAKEGASNQRWSKDNAGNRAIVDERNKALLMALASSGYPPLDQLRILEIGCGRGDVLADLVKLGARPENIVGVDLLEDRIQDGKSAHPNLDLRQANATELPFPEGSFDLVLLYTVISSILDLKMATRVCKEAERVLRPGGAVAWYDMRRKNPSNPNIRPIEHSEIRSLFPDWSVNMRSLTVLPPLARKLGNSASWLYPALSAASMLHSHLFGLIIKPGGPLRTDGE